MEKYIKKWTIIISALLLIGNLSCTGQPPDENPENGDDPQVSSDSPDQDENGAVQPVQTADRFSPEELSAIITELGLPEDPYDRATVLAFDIMEKIGFDTTPMHVTEINYGGAFEDLVNYYVILADNTGDFAVVGTDVDAIKVIKIIFKEPPREDRPIELMPGSDLHERTARQLGILDEDYIFASWVTIKNSFIFRQYTMIGEWEVCTSMVDISVNDVTGEVNAIQFFEQVPFEEVAISVSAEEAETTAVEAIQDSSISPIHTELIQVPPGYHGNPHEEILWEVYFDNGAWCLVTIDGRGWLSYNVPSEPE